MRVLVYGGTGQAKVVYPILCESGHEIGVVFDKSTKVKKPFPCRLIHETDELTAALAECEGFVVCIGGVHGAERYRLSTEFASKGLAPVHAMHSAAYVAKSARIGKGAQIMMRAVVGEETQIGDYCILNTNCTIDHECSIGHGVHIMGGAALAGLVTVEDFASVGTNATILPRIRIGTGAVVGAGAVVTRDVAPNTTVVGVPARPMPQRSAPTQRTAS